eukprot:4074389-Pyramimonas_sp.AAC.1
MGPVAPCRRSQWSLRLARGLPKWMRWRHADHPTGTFGGAHDGATKRLRGMPKRVWWRHGDPPTGA